MRGSMRSLRRIFPAACKAPTGKRPSFGDGLSAFRGTHHEAVQDTASGFTADAASLAEISSIGAEELMDSHSATLQDVTSVTDVKQRGDAAASTVTNFHYGRPGAEGYPMPACVICGEVGHSPQSCPRHDQAHVPEKMCPCGAGLCMVLTAKTLRNAGRRFYKCPLVKNAGGCGFFEWFDGNLSTSPRPVTEDPFSCTHLEPPLCPCGGGVCNIRTAKTQGNMGRQFYRCPLGQGKQCSFFKWCDELVPSSQATSKPCSKCGMDGHWAKDCTLDNQAWNSDPLWQMKPICQEERQTVGACFKCGLPGHWARDCPSQQLSHGGRGATGPFKNCGGDSRGFPIHTGIGGPTEIEMGSKSSISGGCFNCGSSDHWVKDCGGLQGPSSYKGQPQGFSPWRSGGVF